MDEMINQDNSLNFVLKSFKDNTKQSNFFHFFPYFKVTNGVKCAVEKYSLQWLLIIVFTAQKVGYLNNEPLQHWHIHRISSDKLMLIAVDGFGKVLFSEKVPDSIFEFDFLKLFWVENLLMLPSETEGECYI